MSIFTDTFSSTIQGQLGKRQEAMAMTNRTPDVIQYLNSRNSWIRMCSSVDIDGKPDIANNYVLLGGTLTNNSNSFTLKSGIGNTQYNAYSTKTPSGVGHRLGIRPMPGITSVDVKSKSAYGSLREAVVNFQCWDIHQLEDLELLYMRPGYTVLVEWGWLPYLDNTGNLQSTPPDFYNILDPVTTNRQTIFGDLYKKTQTYDSNYDSMFGYVKNYQWSARADGGYDCQTTIISTGEIIESLKVNYVFPNLEKLNNTKNNDGDGFLNVEFSNQGTSPSSKYKEHYNKNTLAGIWAEAYDKLNQVESGDATIANPSYFGGGFFAKFKIPAFSSINTNNENSLGEGDTEIYITLEAVCNIITDYVMPKSKTDGEPLMYISTKDFSNQNDLLCVAHPLQVSVDPSVCLIKSPTWYDSTTGILAATGAAIAGSKVVQGSQALAQDIQDAFTIYNSFSWTTNTSAEGLTKLEDALKKLPDNDLTIFILADTFLKSKSGGKGIQDTINDNLGPSGWFSSKGIKKDDFLGIATQLTRILTPQALKIDYNTETQVQSATTTTYFIKLTITATPSAASQNVITLATTTTDILTSLKYLEELQLPYFSGDAKGCDELGIIGNIYVNLDFLYKLALDPNIESQDKQGKNEISLLKYLKSMMSTIQASIGNISNFEIHVDPINNNIARIIDINYTGDKGDKTYNSLFTLETHNLKSTVRSYTMQSQIFPEQGAMIAIGSQAQGGQLGIQNNTMIDFNKTITDRIIKEKIYPGADQNLPADINNAPKVANNLGGIINLLGSLVVSGSGDSVDSKASSNLDALFSGAKNNLRDLIVGFQSLTKAPGANRNIIPIKFSFEMDGIGGLVIGNLFKLNSDILPKGYKGGANGIGAQLAQTVTGIGHTITNNDWVTKIEALNIVLDDTSNKPDFCTLDLTAIVKASLEAALTQGISFLGGGGNGAGGVGAMQKQGTRAIDDITQIVLHYTEGYGDVSETYETLAKRGLGIHYVVDRGGNVGNPFALTDNVGHAGPAANGISVGIEVANIGQLIPAGNGVYTDFAGRSLTEAARRALNRPTGTGGVAVDYGWEYVGYRYWEEFTDAQINALKTTIYNIIASTPNFKFNYSKNNEVSILQNVFGLKDITTWPVPAGFKSTLTRSWDKSIPGIYAHGTISNQRKDIHPSPKVIQMLKEIRSSFP